jgi:glycolate oxidase iron-sulfur subunit
LSELDELTARCIRCGFCLEACPTFTETGVEMESPRGRIYLVRSAHEGKLRWQEDVREHLSRCLGCRACETACPSGVEYGRIFEIARDRIEHERPHRTKGLLLAGLTDPRKLRAQLGLGRLLPGRKVPALLSRLLSGEAPEADRPEAQRRGHYPPLDEKHLPAVKGEVFLLEGCAMRVLYPRVHEATRRLLRRVGYAVRDVAQGCCGALHAHNGYLNEAHRFAERLEASMREDLPIIVNSAGCGSFLKDREREGHESFAGRVFDASEFLHGAGLTEVLRTSARLEATVAYHDACHLAHGQGIRSQPRELLEAVPGLRSVPLPEADTCCGSAGIYNLTQPKLARSILERKWRNVESTGAEIVATGNPGCHAWIAQAAREHGGHVRVMHTLELLEAAI